MVGCWARRAAYATNCCFCTQRCVVSPKGNGSVSRDQWLRALEQEILHTLFKCLASDSGNLDREGQAKRRHAHIMDKFEDALALHPGRLEMSELCAALSIPERTLRGCCAEFLGMSPTRYHLLRRLNLARTGLQCSAFEREGVADIARRCGFAELGRFAAVYRAVFGELPSVTWRRASVK
jgi:AraC-like DNA-binding protein